MNKKVSIVIPVYNDARAIATTLSSLEKQNYPRDQYEIIVVDNGSTDDTVETVKKFGSVILLYEHKNLSSPYSARNRGIETAKGDIIVLLDATCLPDENWLSEGVKCLIREKAGIVGGNVVFDFEGRKTTAKIFDSITNIKMEESITERQVAKTANLFIDRKVFCKIGLFPEGVRSGADVRWTRKATGHGVKLIFCEKAQLTKPARPLLALIKKQWRVGLAQPEILFEDGKQLRVYKRFLSIFIPVRRRSFRDYIKKHGTPDMEKYLFRLLIVGQVIHAVMCLANCAGIIRLKMNLAKLGNKRDCFKEASATQIDEHINQKIIHVIVAPASLHEDNLKYRRHRLAEYLIKQKKTAEVIWFYPESASPKRPRSYIAAIKKVKQNLTSGHVIRDYAFADFIPGRLMRFKNIAGKLCLEKLRSLLLRHGDKKKVLWYTCPYFPYLAGLFNWNTIVYDCSDLWTSPIGGKGENGNNCCITRLIANAETSIIKSSNLIFATSDYLQEKIMEKTGRGAIVVENGVDLSQFNAAGAKVDLLTGIPRPRLGFLGGMKPKINYSLLQKLACHNHRWNIVLIGPGPLSRNKEFEELLRNENVFWLGAIDSNDAAKYINCFDIGLLPYKEIEYNKAVFPLKLFEYLAAGIPVVGCGLPSTAKYAADSVYSHVLEEHFIEACNITLASLRRDIEESLRRRMELARKAAWEGKLMKIYSQVQKSLSEN